MEPSHSSVAKKQRRDAHGHFATGGSSSPDLFTKQVAFTDNTPPLVSFKVTNPVAYLKLWWKKIMRNEGIDFRFRIHPVTAVVITLIILGGTFSAGFVVSALRNVPVVSQFIPTPTPLPATPNPVRPAAYSGILRQGSDKKFYLQTGDGLAVNLLVPDNVSLEKYVGKRIFATGTYNTQTQYLTVTEATSLEVLPQQVVSIPTDKPEPTPTPFL